MVPDIVPQEASMAQPINPAIFILEDDPDIAGLLKHHLQPAGYGVSWFPTTAGFLDEMHTRRPALVILDVMVPGNSGLDVAKSIRNNSSPLPSPTVQKTQNPRNSPLTPPLPRKLVSQGKNEYL